MVHSSDSSPLQSSVTVKVRSHYRPAPVPIVQKRQPLSSRKTGLSPLARGVLWGSLLSLTAFASAIAGVGMGFFSPWTSNVLSGELPNTATAQPSSEPSQADLFPYRISRPVNILVMGIDRVETANGEQEQDVFRGRSDTMLLVRFDPRENTLKLLSIPRDTRVVIPNVGYTKINDANVYGGAKLAARVIRENFGEVPIDRYVQVTTNAFRELVDLVGGVEVFVPTPMVYEDKTQNLTINLEAGLQTLSGEQAEQFARFRHDANGDIGRVQRQEILLKALQKRLNNPTLLTRIPQAIQILQNSVATNLSVEEILALANFGRQLERQEVQMVMLPGRFSQLEEFDGKSYWVMSHAGGRQIMRQYFDVVYEADPWTTPRQRSPESLYIALQNASDDPSAMQRVKDYLREQGFYNLYEIAESPQLLRETEIVVQQGDLEAAHYLQRRLGGGHVEASSTGDLGSDLTLRVGMDVNTWLGNLPITTSEAVRQSDNTTVLVSGDSQ
ncbi:MAG: Cell envelope-associated transcriptional attenuator LytR-CpsA-Psr, subfamily [Cyanobacteriota bacterium]